jgi:hypothetical protein
MVGLAPDIGDAIAGVAPERVVDDVCGDVHGRECIGRNVRSRLGERASQPSAWLMKKLIISGFLFRLLSLAAPLAGDGIIHNDTVWRDTSGNEIWCNGGHIIREKDVFYWVGYDTGPGRWPWRINLYSSRNLADWKFENSVIRMEGKFARMGWAGRPGLLHCPATTNT